MPSATDTRLSGSCQQITHEEHTPPNAAGLTVRCNLADPDINPAIAGHIINNIPLVPSGLYGDMAAVVARYIWSKLRPNHEATIGVNVCDMHVDKTFIPKWPVPHEGEWFEMEAIADLTSSETNSGKIQYHFRKLDDPKIQEFAGCTVTFESVQTWKHSWSAYEHIIASRVQNLVARANVESSGRIRTIQRGQAYERFKTFVDYHHKYQNMREVIMDYDALEATAVLEYQCDPAMDYCGPFFLDGSCHLSGWVCNESEADSKRNAYISHGWGAKKLSPEFSVAASKTTEFRTYVQMQTKGKDVLGGDVFILQGDKIVGVWEGVEFKRIPRRVLNIFLPPQKK
ncbi:polyketide synthase [Friedmanniomyces endolithicus]|uniref:Polyketide synthase n=1 Tax=Friedmanniomyces endolithicus TaxID=329885 RepID=A0AAN6JZ71_9PEZI|nr:polyketide synthase [Friedmanniomyces endolithicus]KAK0789721.1 polyketide synthase [Friedmanniomyces endolithicus]KAK0799913.1 polyketide synthase [Friedmanniomyces endolithicus]KAK0820238.1 polyketide synthase [Friedmanniomyces endolithicus]KAK0871140.1 polyketide synthase [Friedmanniomyces endolithicus]